MLNQCYAHISNEAVQLHGGMGLTDDLDIGLYLKRARVSMQILGDTGYHLDRYARCMGY
jgi:acyl-CoA dehydrogenase